MKSAAMSVSVLLAAAISVYGADYYVSPGNAGAQAPYSTWETAAATIEDAMALAILDKGCTVTLDDGVYGLAEMLCVTNTMTLTSRNGRARTFVEPGPSFPADTRLCMVRAPTKTETDRPVVSSITFRNATITSGYGAGVFVRYPGGVVQDCRITGCKMLTRDRNVIPSAALCGSTGTFVYRCIIDNNEARWVNPAAQNNVPAGVAGITFVEDGADSATGGPVVENCLVVHNYGPAISYDSIAYANPVFRSCTAVDNGGDAGIDKSFITTSGAFRPVSLENDFTLVSGFTFADIPYDGPQVWNGGVLENCRVTRCLRTDAGSNQGFVRVRF